MKNNIAQIVDNGNYVTFLYKTTATPLDIKKDVASISFIPLTTNTARYPHVSMVSTPLISIKYDGDKEISIDQRNITTPASASAVELYNILVGYFNTIPSGIIEITDPLLIAEITDADNWVDGSYVGSTTGLVAGSYYYDLVNSLKYEFDGTTLIRINFNIEV